MNHQKIDPKTATAVITVFILLFTATGIDVLTNQQRQKPETFIGIDIAYGHENEVYTIANEVQSYVNLIILGSLNLTEDTPALTRVCDFLYQKGFYFIIYVGFSKTDFLPPRGPDQQFLKNAPTNYQDQFLGAYFFDEAGGKQLDAKEKVVHYATSYTYAAEAYVSSLVGALTLSTDWYQPPKPQLFTSDYALYWYDYVGGYDTVFAEFVDDQNRQIPIALNRGAANSLDKEWGVIITWSCATPCFENSTALYNDLNYAYQSGAKYIVVFNTIGNLTNAGPYGILTTEHLQVMKNFWSEIKTNAKQENFPAKTAYVLPKDYGFGFRNPTDKIWGLWEADNQSAQIYKDATELLAQYGTNLDIVYETRIDNQPINLPYQKLIYWNGTTIQK
jgi:hypothetical protein